MRMNGTISIREMSFLAFFGMFIFISLNREMGIGGIEFRYLDFALGMICLLFTIHDILRTRLNKGARTHLDHIILFYMTYYFLIVLAIFNAIFHPSAIDLSSFSGVAILHLFNLLALVLVVLNREYLRSGSLIGCVCFSGGVLALSQIAVYFGMDLSALLSDPSTRVMAVDLGQGEHVNLFGQYYRVSGFAEDPNYACLFNMFTIAAAVLLYKRKKTTSIIVIALSLVGIAVAWSRTVVFGSLGCILAVFVCMALPKLKQDIARLVVMLISAAALALPFLHIDILQTVTTRYGLWLNAFDLFCESPIIGSGLTSFRAYNAMQSNGWLVHPHSSYWETISEFGILAFICLIAIYLCAARIAVHNPVALFVVLVSVLFSVNFDCTYLQFGIVVFAAIPLMMISEKPVDCVKGKSLQSVRGELAESGFHMAIRGVR